jgi:hypothetical protein
MSIEPPAGKGMTIRIGRAGLLAPSAACAGATNPAHIEIRTPILFTWCADGCIWK